MTIQKELCEEPGVAKEKIMTYFAEKRKDKTLYQIHTGNVKYYQINEQDDLELTKEFTEEEVKRIVRAVKAQAQMVLISFL